ncbi:MAG: nucleotidyltransferase family protein [Acidobacteriota bacterium]
MGCSPALFGGLAALIDGTTVPWTSLEATPAELMDACDEEGLAGLLHHHLGLGAGPDWPETVREEIASRACAAAAEELLRQSETIATLTALGSAGVPLVILKGTALAYTVYTVPSCRPRVDTDLMIPRALVGRASRVMEDLGYTASVNSGGERLFAQFQFWREDAYGVQHAFDFHWKISTQPMFADVLTPEELAAESVPVAALGPYARAAGHVHALVLACIHPAMHHRNAEHLTWMSDIRLLASGLSEADFDRLAALALAREVAAVCVHELLRARSRFTFNLPPRVVTALAAVTDEPSAAYLRQSRRWLDELMSSIQSLPRLRDRVGLLREVAFPRPAYVLAAYGMASWFGTALLPALYVHRILKGMQKIAFGTK